VYTDIAKVTDLLEAAGVAVDVGDVSQAIDDAAQIVQQYHLFLTGRVSETASGKLVDRLGRFTERVRAGARIFRLRATAGTLSQSVLTPWEVLTDWTVRPFEENPFLSVESTAVSGVVDSTTLLLTDPDFEFGRGDFYLVEDLAKYELAERYKAAALVCARQEGAVATFTTTRSERLGPIAVTTGAREDSSERSANLFEAEFLKIVGPQMAAV